MNLWITGTTECEFEIPILPDIYGTNPIDRCLGVSKIRRRNQKVYKYEIMEDFYSCRNHVLAGHIFEGISHYGFMHASYIISEALIVAIELNLQNVGQYIESRLQSVEHSFKNK